MTELSSRAYDLTRAARFLDYPTAFDRERIERALRARLGAEVFEAPTPVMRSGAMSAVRATWPLASNVVSAVIIITVGVLGAFYLFKGNTATVGGIRASVVNPVPSTPVGNIDATPSRTPEPLPSSSDPLLGTARPRVPTPGAASDRLAQEVALMARATSSLRAHHALQALQVLDEHQRLFPSGLLTEDRHAARAQALCELGRQREARADIASLDPKSPAAARSKQACSESSRPAR